MKQYLTLLAALTVLASCPRTLAEKVDMTPEELRKTATHVVIGTVVGVYHREETSGEWRYTYYVAEVRLAACEKGEGVKAGDVVYVRYWHRSWTGQGHVPPSTAGHRGLPPQGETTRIYLARNAYDGFSYDNKDGGFNVIGANGFEKWKPAAGK